MKKYGYYTVLNVHTEASSEEIQNAYQREKMAYDMSGKAFHDRRAKELREAYEVLSDEEKRKEYDKEQEKTVLTMEELYEKIERETPRTRVDDLIDQGQKDPLGLFIMIVAMFFLALITHVMEN